MIRSFGKLAVYSALVLTSSSAAHAASLAPLASFGGGDGWLAPGDRSYLNIDNTQRGFAYNPVTDHLLIVNRSGGLSINILDGATGDDLGTLSGTGSLSGGTFAANMIGVADDGAIYVGNLTTNGTDPFTVYRWENEAASTPTVAYSGAPLAGARLGDTFDVIGNGTDTRLVAGYYHTPAVAGNNSFALFDTSDGLSFTATHVDVSSNPPAAGDFRLGITFRDEDTVIGSQTTNRLAHIVDVSGSTGTLVADFATEGAANNPMDFALMEGLPLLATVNTNDSRLFVYDITEPFDMVDPNPNIAVATTTSPPHNSNGNGTGQVKFGPISGSTAILYAMDTNNGIQAFELTLSGRPENNGDYNGDGFVDAADYVLWRATEGDEVDPGTGADGSGDGTVGPEDYTHWVERFGNIIGTGPQINAPVPEPSTIVSLILAVVGGLALRRRGY